MQKVQKEEANFMKNNVPTNQLFYTFLSAQQESNDIGISIVVVHST